MHRRPVSFICCFLFCFFFVIMAFFIFQLSSQHPYAEIFIGEPFVYTANIWNKTEVTISIKNILSKQVRKERLSLEVVIGLSTLFPLLYLLNTLLLQLTVFIQDQTICSFRVFLWRNVGKIKRLHRKSGENKLSCPYSSQSLLINSIGVKDWGDIWEDSVGSGEERIFPRPFRESMREDKTLYQRKVILRWINLLLITSIQDALPVLWLD